MGNRGHRSKLSVIAAVACAALEILVGVVAWALTVLFAFVILFYQLIPATMLIWRGRDPYLEDDA